MTPQISDSTAHCAPIPELGENRLSELSPKQVIEAVREHLGEAFGDDCVKINRRPVFSYDRWRGDWWFNGAKQSYVIFVEN